MAVAITKTTLKEVVGAAPVTAIAVAVVPELDVVPDPDFVVDVERVEYDV